MLCPALLAALAARADDAGPAATAAPPMVVAQPSAARSAAPPALVTARPHPAPMPAPAPEEFVDKQWYGWKLLILHGIADTVATAGFALTEVDPIAGSVVGGIGFAARVFGSLGLHIANDNYLVGAFSIVANVGLPAAGTLTSLAIVGERPGPKPEVFAGLALGAVAATAFDVSMAWSHLLGKSRPALRVGPGSVEASFRF